MTRLFSFIFIILIFSQCQLLSKFGGGNKSNDYSSLKTYEDSIIAKLNRSRSAETDELRRLYNDEVVEEVESLLKEKNVWSYSFPKLSKMMSTIKSSDDVFRFFNWNLELTNGQQEYFGYVFINNKKSNKGSSIKLTDKSRQIYDAENETLDEKKWFGALYYNILPFEFKGKTHYILFGWDGNDIASTKKILDVMTFNGSRLKFGAPVFKYEKEYKRRVFLQYKKGVSVSLNYDEKKEAIIFDHLSPLNPHMEGIYEFYGPDGSYDGFVLEGDFWIYTEDFDARTKLKNEEDFNDPNKQN